jgi:hypothetical protein
MRGNRDRGKSSAPRVLLPAVYARHIYVSHKKPLVSNLRQVDATFPPARALACAKSQPTTTPAKLMAGIRKKPVQKTLSLRLPPKTKKPTNTQGDIIVPITIFSELSSSTSHLNTISVTNCKTISQNPGVIMIRERMRHTQCHLDSSPYEKNPENAPPKNNAITR